MQRLHYAGGTVLIADEICSALLDYASVLADARLADVVTVPVIDEAGERTQAKILVGPASQLWASPASGEEDAADPAVVEDLRKRAARVGPSVVAIDPQAQHPFPDPEDAADI